MWPWVILEIHLWIWVCVFLSRVNNASLCIVCARHIMTAHVYEMCPCVCSGMRDPKSSGTLSSQSAPTLNQSLQSCWFPLLNISHNHFCSPSLLYWFISNFFIPHLDHCTDLISDHRAFNEEIQHWSQDKPMSKWAGSFIAVLLHLAKLQCSHLQKWVIQELPPKLVMNT